MFKTIFAFLILGALSAQAETILVHAHRGGRAARPENTLPSFEYGIEQGADVLELDWL
jgi:glycerophosphoryl diester phosphodiesterase